jgi:L-asparaginase
MTSRTVRRLPVLCLLLFAASASLTTAADLPRVRLVATGGTISNRSGGRLSADELLQSMPALSRYARGEAEQFANTSSAEISLDQWLLLARHLNDVFRRDNDLAGIVVTSGTDTLEELAYFLDLTVRDVRPVVVVGSMRNPSTLGYEGAANLLEGFRVAADPASKNKGVLVVLNDEINAAREVTKTDALRLQTFQSRPYGILGVVDSDRVVYYRDVVKRHTAKSEFDLEGVTALPRVDIAMVYQGATGDVIKAMADAGAKGIVVAVAGAGATAPGQSEGFAYAASKGVVLAMATRTGSGRIAARMVMPMTMAQAGVAAAPGQLGAGQAAAGGGGTSPGARQGGGRGGSVGAEDLTPLKARILLMLALTKTQDAATIQRMFTEY